MDESTKQATTLGDICPCILDQIRKSIARKTRENELDNMLKLVEQLKPKKLNG